MKRKSVKPVIAPQEIAIDDEAVFKGVGYGSQASDPDMLALYRDIKAEAIAAMDIEAGFIRIEPGFTLAQDHFVVDAVRFDCGAAVSGQLAGSVGIICFACTLGARFDLRLHTLFTEKDPLHAMFFDSVGSVAVDAVADRIEQRIIREEKKRNFACSARLSPGYCEWNVGEQHRFFALFPNNFLGISLSESAMMTPVKSISGVIGIGPDVKRLHSGCLLCTQRDCQLRK
jgi:hypothetical protein